MKELIAKLMTHGYSEHQAQEFLDECYKTFEPVILLRFIKKFRTSVMEKINEN